MAKLTNSLAFNLKRIRKEKSIKSADKLAEMAEVNPQVLRKAEAGYHIPETKTLEKLAETLGVEETEFFLDPAGIREPSLHEAMSVLLKALESKIGHYVPANQAKAKAQGSEIPLDEEKLLEKIRKLTSAQKQSLDRMADQLLAKNAQKTHKDTKETTG
jgi:transcriptional regulator with XRE-family HTH domain